MATLLEQAKAAITEGRLPDASVGRTWGGHGTAHDCALCGRSIKPEEVEIEFEPAPVRGRQRPSVFLHVACHNALVQASEELARQSGAP